jgi:hypothetical protein
LERCWGVKGFTSEEAFRMVVWDEVVTRECKANKARKEINWLWKGGRRTKGYSFARVVVPRAAEDGLFRLLLPIK